MIIKSELSPVYEDKLATTRRQSRCWKIRRRYSEYIIWHSGNSVLRRSVSERQGHTYTYLYLFLICSQFRNVGIVYFTFFFYLPFYLIIVLILNIPKTIYKWCKKWILHSNVILFFYQIFSLLFIFLVISYFSYNKKQF